MISIYIHIPFCAKKCDYCSFYSIQASGEVYEKYTNAIIKQINSFNIKENVKTVYFGGGTPSILGADRLNRILNIIKDKFDMSQCEEITFEINPKTASQDDLIKLRQNGFNRISIGLQSTNNSLLEDIGRIHSYNDFLNTYHYAKIANFDNISVDLIYGLPSQKLSDHLESITNLLNLNIQHISVYGLTIEPNTKMYQYRNSYDFPDEDEEFEMYLKTSEILEQNGFIHYEISNFSKIGFESKHNIGYWQGCYYLGFGPSAHSFYNNKRFSCNMNVNDYINSSQNLNDYFLYTDYDQQPQLNQNELSDEKIMLGLRLKKGVELNKQKEKKADLYVKAGYMRKCGNLYSFTPSGWYISNTIISNILME